MVPDISARSDDLVIMDGMIKMDRAAWTFPLDHYLRRGAVDAATNLSARVPAKAAIFVIDEALTADPYGDDLKRAREVFATQPGRQ